MFYLFLSNFYICNYFLFSCSQKVIHNPSKFTVIEFGHSYICSTGVSKEGIDRDSNPFFRKFRWECKLVQALWRIVWRLLKN